MVKIEMCNHNICIKSNDCYRFLGALSNPSEHSYRKFYNLCSEKNNYKWQWFGYVEELKEQLEKEGKLQKQIENQEIQKEKTEKEVTENINKNIEGND